ncbi:MAG: c-type cytochrome domain-containing protein, partial [Leadbetterella sp.]
MIQTILRYASLGLNVFVLFILFFREKLSLPSILQYSGKLHPLVLHIPIGALVIYVLFQFVFKNILDRHAERIILLLLAFSAAVTALFGFFLGQDGADSPELSYHRNFGVIFSIVCYLAYELSDYFFDNKVAKNTVLISITGLCMIVGHQGGSITHGEDFLSFSNKKNEDLALEITGDATLYDAKIYPIFKEKCVACHNNSKAKGDLNMSSIEKLLKGGKNGAFLVAHQAEKSLFFSRISLPKEDKKHMPPTGKEQLTSEEIKVLENWVKEGANTKKKLKEVAQNSFFYDFAKQSLESKVKVKNYTFSEASQSTIDELSTPFLHIAPIAISSPALKANFFVKEKFDISKLN